MVLQIVWDKPFDAEKFVDAYVAYVEGHFGHPADMANGARLCWTRAADHLYLTRGLADTSIVLGPNEMIVESALEVVRAD